jgi:hypothetical protein
MTRSLQIPTAVRVLVLVAATAAGALGVAQAADSIDTAAAPAAHWVQRKLDYTYVGFTTRYTCDGLEDDVRNVLLALGARKRDLEIQSMGCVRFNGVEPFPGVRATFWVLVPVTAGEAGRSGDKIVAATRWQTVNLVKDRGYPNDQGRCELLDQIKRQALPLFTSRNLNFHSACVPYQESLGDIGFTVDVLRPVPVASPGA